MSEIRAPLIVTEPAIEGDPALRLPLAIVEPVSDGASRLLEALGLVEPVANGPVGLRCALLMLETVIRVPEEGELATDLFCSELGQSWEAVKSPTFNTRVRRAASFRTVRNSMTPYPAWDFEVSFPWLPRDLPFMSFTAIADVLVICGFFKHMRGQHRAWLFRDCDDYRARAYAQATGDGVTTEYPFIASVMGSDEPVGQVDLLERFAFAPGDVTAAADTIAEVAHGLATGDGPFFVANTGGGLPAGLAATTPYWAIRVDADTLKLAASKANALANTPVNITTAGTGAHSLTGGWAVYVGGALVAPADITFSTPNGFIFDVAPVLGAAITADFDYLFVCNFLSDVADFKRFAGELWELQQVRFRADPP